MLTVAFGLAIILGAIRMVTAKPPTVEDQPVAETLPYILWGVPLGLVSGIIGIGGGVLIIPILVFFLKFNMHQAVAHQRP